MVHQALASTSKSQMLLEAQKRIVEVKSTFVNFLREDATLTKLQRRLLSSLIIQQIKRRDGIELLIKNKVDNV